MGDLGLLGFCEEVESGDFLFLGGDESLDVLDLEFFLAADMRASKAEGGLDMTRRETEKRDRGKETRDETLTVREKQKHRRKEEPKEDRKCNGSMNE